MGFIKNRAVISVNAELKLYRQFVPFRVVLC